MQPAQMQRLARSPLMAGCDSAASPSPLAPSCRRNARACAATDRCKTDRRLDTCQSIHVVPLERKGIQLLPAGPPTEARTSSQAERPLVALKKNTNHVLQTVSRPPVDC